MSATAIDKTMWWSEQGQISCLEHASYRGSDTWMWGRWQPITAVEAREFERDVGRAPACEECAAMKRNAERGS